MSDLHTQDGTRLFYRDWGTGKPVVLIHGWPLNGDMWEYQAGSLVEQGFRVITYDRRGFGRSEQPWAGYDYDTLADDLAAVMTELDLRDAALVGFSMGGGEVARYLTRHGASRVSHAVLISAVTPMLVQTPDHEDGVDRSVFDQMVEGLNKDRPHFLATFGKQFFGAGLLNFSISHDILQWAQGMALQASKHATIACVRSFSETDFRPDMASFTMPTLVMHGTSDATVPPNVSGRAAASLIAGAELIEYDGAPHATFFVEKDRLTADLVAFLRGGSHRSGTIS